MFPHGLLFHHFHDDRHPPGQGSLSAEDFADIIRFVGRDRILPARDWMDRAIAGDLDDGDLCLSFDDNLRCQFDIAAPVLRDLGLTAFWFIYTSPLAGAVERLEIYRYFRSTCFDGVDEFYASFDDSLAATAFADEVAAAMTGVDTDTYLADKPFYSPADRRFRYLRDRVLGDGRYAAVMDAMIDAAGLDVASVARTLWMDADCLRRLDGSGHVVGLHSHNHPTTMSELDAAAQEAEFRANFDALAAVLGSEPVTMAHPCGDYNGDTLAVLRRLGIRLGFRADMNGAAATELEYPRENHAVTLARMGR
jgi:peptidoglycan/xylan/chitin deacetylase (PgdA/CDA1 family)